jgi:hypothetical protein
MPNSRKCVKNVRKLIKSEKYIRNSGRWENMKALGSHRLKHDCNLTVDVQKRFSICVRWKKKGSRKRQH